MGDESIGWLRRHMRTQLAGSVFPTANAVEPDEANAQTGRPRPGSARLAVQTVRGILQRPPAGGSIARLGSVHRGAGFQHDTRRTAAGRLQRRRLDAGALPVRRRPGEDVLSPGRHDLCNEASLVPLCIQSRRSSIDGSTEKGFIYLWGIMHISIFRNTHLSLCQDVCCVPISLVSSVCCSCLVYKV